MQLLPSDNAMQTFAFASPFMYVILMLYTKFTGLIKPFNPLYHNYNMIMQSCLLLGLTTYEYYRIAELYDIPTHNLLEISHVGSIEHQKHDTSLILTIFLISKVFEWIDTIALIVNNKKNYSTSFMASRNNRCWFLYRILYVLWILDWISQQLHTYYNVCVLCQYRRCKKDRKIFNPTPNYTTIWRSIYELPLIHQSTSGEIQKLFTN